MSKLEHEKELESIAKREYFEALKVCAKLYPDIFEQSQAWYGYKIVDFELYYQRKQVAEKINYFSKCEEFTRPFNKEYYLQAKGHVL